MDLQAQLEALYAGPLADFTAARNELAKRLKASGDAEGAKLVKALPKPVVTAWAVNVVAHRDPGLLRDIIVAGDAVRQAQLSGAAAAQLQGAVAARRDRLQAAMQAAAKVLQEAGNPVTPATLERVGRTFEAVAAYGEHMPEPKVGRLAHDVEPPGFEVLAALAAQAPSRPTPHLSLVPPPAEMPAAPSIDQERVARLARLRARVRETADAVEQARADHARVEQEAKELELRAEQTRRRAEALLDPIDKAEAAYLKARAALDREEE